MSEHLQPSTHDRAEAVKVLEAALLRHFSDDWLVVDGCAMHVDEIVEQLQRHLAQIERTHAAFATWLEERAFLRDERRCEIDPLRAGLRRFLIEEFGADSPLMREFGFEPPPRSSHAHLGEERAEEDDDQLA